VRISARSAWGSVTRVTKEVTTSHVLADIDNGRRFTSSLRETTRNFTPTD
jgi:hypothetical protein